MALSKDSLPTEAAADTRDDLYYGHDRSYFISFIISLGNETRCIREGQRANSHFKRDLGLVSR